MYIIEVLKFCEMLTLSLYRIDVNKFFYFFNVFYCLDIFAIKNVSISVN